MLQKSQFNTNIDILNSTITSNYSERKSESISETNSESNLSQIVSTMGKIDESKFENYEIEGNISNAYISSDLTPSYQGSISVNSDSLSQKSGKYSKSNHPQNEIPNSGVNSESGSYNKISEDIPLFNNNNPQKKSFGSFQQLKNMAGEITPWLIFASFVAVLTSFQFGYSIGVTNTPEDAISNCNESSIYTRWIFPDCIPMNKIQWSILVSAQTLGGLFGGVGCGTIAEIIGRRTALWCNCFIFMIALWLQALAPNMWIFWIGRFIVGFASGIASGVVSMYIGETAPDSVRGGFGVLPQLAVTIGIFVSQFLGIFLSSRPAWRLLMGTPLIFLFVQLILLPFCPESPRWLANKRKFEEFDRSLSYFRKSGIRKEEEFANLKNEIEQVSHISLRKKLQGLIRLSLLKPLIIGIALSMAQQLSGINVVFYYSTSIFEGAGVSRPDIATACVGLVNVIFTIFVTFIIDLLGRRTLLIIGQSCQIFFFILLSIATIINFFISERITNAIMSWISIVCVVGFVISFALALGPIPWLILAEIFPDDARGLLSSICVGVNWLCNFIVAITFPTVAEYLKAFCFLPFVVLMIIFLTFTIFVVPETKGKMPASNLKSNNSMQVVPSSDSLDGVINFQQ